MSTTRSFSTGRPRMGSDGDGQRLACRSGACGATTGRSGQQVAHQHFARQAVHAVDPHRVRPAHPCARTNAGTSACRRGSSWCTSAGSAAGRWAGTGPGSSASRRCRRSGRVLGVEAGDLRGHHHRTREPGERRTGGEGAIVISVLLLPSARTAFEPRACSPGGCRTVGRDLLVGHGVSHVVGVVAVGSGRGHARRGTPCGSTH